MLLLKQPLKQNYKGENMSEKVAFIGLGAMGGPMASNIIKKEYADT